MITRPNLQSRNSSKFRSDFTKIVSIALACLFLIQVTAGCAGAYSLGSTVADMRQPASVAGDTSCPQFTRFSISTPGTINRQWSTFLGTSPVTILTSAQSSSGQITEVGGVIQTSLAVWTGVGSALTPSSLGALQTTSIQNACNSSDGINTICLDQSDSGFTAGVLAFTRVVSADLSGEQLSASSPASTFVGEILDADTLVRPGDATTTFATPAALASNPNSYDLQSILTHEIGHSFGFSHSAVWNAVMFPYAPPPGQFAGTRPTAQQPDAPLSDDDRTGLRVLYPNSTDTTHVGTIRGHVLPANPLVLPVSPPGVTGIYGAQVVAVNNTTGSVAAATFGGWSCTDPGPAQFDGSYSLSQLPVGTSQTYQIYAEPLDGAVALSLIIETPAWLCRNSSSDPGWPAQYACTVPPQAEPFSARIQPGP